MDFQEEDDIIRSSCSQMFLKKDVLKKFAKFRKTPALEFLFNKAATLQACNFFF